tara:strand:+ start:791 stop:1927 length:1137 start_codon:yes stop_codon:yes gene_type:complete
MAFNLGGFIGGVSEGVTDAIIREEERLDNKLALNNQEASLQRREKNKQRMAKEKLTEELTEKLSLYHTEDQVAEIMGKGVNVAQEVFTNSSTAFQNNKDPQALYNWGKTKEANGVGSIDDSIAGITTGSSEDDLTKTVSATGTGFFKPQAPTIKTFTTIDASLENVYQNMAKASIAGNTKLLSQLTASKDALLSQRMQAVKDGILEGTEGSSSYDMAKTNQDKIIATARTRVYNSNKIPTLDGRIRETYEGNVGRIAAAEIDIAESLSRDWQEGKAPESFVNRIAGIKEDANNAARVAAQEMFFNTDEKLRFKSNNPKSKYYGFEINEGEDLNNNVDFKKANFRNGDAVVWKTTNQKTGVSRITYTTYSATHNKLYGN